MRYLSLFLVALSVACGGSSPAEPPAPGPTTGTVAGLVTDSIDGTPIEGARILAGSQGTITGADGRYTISGLAPSTGLELSVTRSGFFQANVKVAVTAGQTTSRNLGLARLALAGSVAGTVNDGSSGAALEGVVVTLGLASTTTDLGGHYQLTSIAPGTGLAITAARTGYFQLGAAVDVTAGQLTARDLVMTAIPGTGTVAGTIIDYTSGAPLAGVIVTIGAASAITGPDGRYTISGLEPSATLLVSATHPGHYQFLDTVAVAAGQVTAEDFSMFAVSATGGVGGVVSDSRSGLPLSDVVVTVGGFSARTDASGRYGLGGVATGTGLAITATRAGYYQSAGTADVIAGQTATHDIALEHVVGDVAGVVTDWKTGSPVQGVTVTLAGTTRVTDIGGAYTFIGLLPGTGLAITAVKAGYLDFTGTVEVVADQTITRNVSIILDPCLPNPCGLPGAAHGTCVPNGPLPVCTCDATWAQPLCASCDTGYYLQGGTCLPGLGVYVSTTGDDTTGDGSLARPYRTITRGLSGVLPHTVIRVAAGSYGAGETFPLRPPDGVSLVGDGAAVTTITGSASVGTGPPIGIVNYQTNITLPDWTRLEGLTITNTGGIGVVLFYEAFGDVSISPQLRHNVINGAPNGVGAGLNAAVLIFGHSYNNPNAFLSPTIADNTITGTATPGLTVYALEGAVLAPLLTGNFIVTNAPPNGGLGVQAAAFILGGSPRFDHNTFTANKAMGIWMFSSSSSSALAPAFVANKITWTAPATGINAGIFLEEAQSGTGSPSFADNTIVGSSGAAFKVSSDDGTGTVAVDLGGGSAGSLGRNTIRGSTDLDDTRNPVSLSATHNWWSDDPPTRIVPSTTAGAVVTTAPASDQVLSFNVSPASGTAAGGETITLTAGPSTFFLDDIGATRDRISITVGGVPATNVWVSTSGDLLTALTPAGTAGAAQVVVTNPAGQTGSAAFTYAP